MKRLLLVLILLYIFMPANARGKAYVYKFKETHTGMRTGDESGLAKYKETWTGYAIIEPNDNNTARMWRIYLWKSDGLTEVDMQDMMTCGFLQIPVGKNTVWIITYEDETQNFILSGIAKPAKAANPNPFIAASISGKVLLADEEDIYVGICSGKISLSLNTYLTAAFAYTHSGEETVYYVMDYLQGLYMPE